MNELKKATVEEIIYRNPDNGYAVVDMIDEDGFAFVAVGSIPTADVGEKLELQGCWTEHKVYGKQFRVEAYQTVIPTTLDEIERYLCGGSIKGIGPSVAKQIVAKFGENTFDVLDNEPERLLELSGIGRVKLQMITSSYNESRMNRDVMLGLQRLDISTTYAVKIYKKYGADCVRIIRENPYKLIDDIENIGFKTADRIAKNAGIAYDSEFRICAGIKYMLEWAKQEGHTYLPYNVLVSATVTTLLVDEMAVRNSLEKLLANYVLVKNTLNDEDIVFLPYMRRMEMDVAQRLVGHVRHKKNMLAFDINSEIRNTAKRIGIELAQSQYDALCAMFTEGVVVITGGPGTGKTTILKIAIEMMRSWGMTYELAAPTGRAAKRMSAATGTFARTVHRLLEYSFVDHSFMRDEQDPLEADFVIIDEMSMVDIQLMNALLRAVTEETRIILVGDADQLPSVGAGNVLRDILDSEKVFSVRLTEVYRQAQQSMIVANAHRINNGKEPVLDDRNSDFIFEEKQDPNDILNEIVERYCASLNAKEPPQLLAPMKKGVLGVININKCLQQAANPSMLGKKEIIFGETIFRVGDRVMQTKNNYSIEWSKNNGESVVEEGKGIFNGDIGVVTMVNAKDRIVEVTFEDGCVAEYSQEQLAELDLAYCISIHKSQGSEFATVVMPLAGGPPSFLTRNLLYTAVTRAKKKVHIIGRRETVMGMVANKSIKYRNTALRYMIEELYENY